METAADRLRKTRISKGFETAYQAAEAFGWNKHTYSANENGNATFSFKAAKRYASAFGVDATWLYEGLSFDNNQLDVAAQKRDHGATSAYYEGFVNGRSHSSKIPSQTVRFSHNVPVLGYVEAGAWREMSEFEGALEVVPYYDPEFADRKLFGLRVRGSSMNKVYPEGATVVCAPYPGTLLRNGDFVIVRRTEGALVEATVKQLEVTRDGQWKFWPRSDDPRFQEALIPPARNEWQQLGWEIIGVVVGESKKVMRMGEIITDGMPA